MNAHTGSAQAGGGRLRDESASAQSEQKLRSLDCRVPINKALGTQCACRLLRSLCVCVCVCMRERAVVLDACKALRSLITSAGVSKSDCLIMARYACTNCSCQNLECGSGAFCRTTSIGTGASSLLPHS